MAILFVSHLSGKFVDKSILEKSSKHKGQTASQPDVY